MRVFTVAVEQRYTILANDEEDARACVEAVYDRATEGRGSVHFDDDTVATLIENTTTEVKPK